MQCFRGGKGGDAIWKSRLRKSWVRRSRLQSSFERFVQDGGEEGIQAGLGGGLVLLDKGEFGCRASR